MVALAQEIRERTDGADGCAKHVKNASLKDMKEAFTQLRRDEIWPGTLVTLFFSGHGAEHDGTRSLSASCRHASSSQPHGQAAAMAREMSRARTAQFAAQRRAFCAAARALEAGKTEGDVLIEVLRRRADGRLSGAPNTASAIVPARTDIVRRRQQHVCDGARRAIPRHEGESPRPR